jgi:hypothetical protein
MGTLYIPFLVDAARLTGYPVIDVPGQRTRGHGGMRAIEGVAGHHTADGPGEYPSLFIVRDGRADLKGPLSHLGLGRSGTIYVIAAGLCYHAGASRWAGFLDLNDEFIGIEAESSGVRDDWTPAQRDCYPRLVAALLYFMRRGPERFAGHREICLPPGRKIDPAFWDLPWMRQRVGWLLGDPLARIPRFANPPRRVEGEDAAMFIETAPPVDQSAPKTQWPAKWVSFGFDPPKGWGGAGVVKITISAPGGYIHEAAWWRRRDAATAVGVPNQPHDRVPAAIPGGREQFPGFQRELVIPDRCDELELLIAAPGGVQLAPYYER